VYDILITESVAELTPAWAPELGPSASSVAEDELEGEEARRQDIVSFSQWAEKQGADQAAAPAKETEKKLNDSPQVTNKIVHNQCASSEMIKNYI